MQAVILSIRKEWVRLILSGDKTLEVRKTKPNYCAFTISRATYPLRVFLYESKANGGRGMVVGWVDCEGVTEIPADADAETVRATAARACLRVQDFDTYRRGHKPYICQLGGRTVYAWRLGEPNKIEPMGLMRFGIDRAPQSWQWLRPEFADARRYVTLPPTEGTE